MRAYKRALVALNAFFHLPFRNVDGNAAFFVSSGAARESAVLMVFKRAYRQFVAFHAVHRHKNVVDEIIAGFCSCFGIGSVSPCCGNVNFYNGVNAHVDSGVVHVNNVFALQAVAVFNRFLQVFNSILQRNNVGQFKERRLHNHVNASAEADLLCNFYSVNNIEVNIVFGNIAFNLPGQMFFQFFCAPVAVKKEGAAFFQPCGNVVFINVGLVVYGYKIRSVDKVRSADGLFAETQVRNGNAAGFFGIVGEIALSVHIGVIADNFNCALVGANGAVAAEAPELAALGAFAGNVNFVAGCQRSIGNVINNADGKVVFRVFGFKVFVNGQNVGRGQILAAKAVAAADNQRIAACVIERAAHIHVQRFAECARLFGAVKHGNAFNGFRNCRHKMLNAERTVQVNGK